MIELHITNGRVIIAETGIRTLEMDLRDDPMNADITAKNGIIDTSL